MYFGRARTKQRVGSRERRGKISGPIRFRFNVHLASRKCFTVTFLGHQLRGLGNTYRPMSADGSSITMVAGS